MDVNTRHDKFVYHLQEMYYVENRFVEVLDEMAADVANDDLRDGLERHREQTEGHVRRLDEVFDALDEPSTEGRVRRSTPWWRSARRSSTGPAATTTCATCTIWAPR